MPIFRALKSNPNHLVSEAYASYTYTFDILKGA